MPRKKTSKKSPKTKKKVGNKNKIVGAASKTNPYAAFEGEIIDTIIRPAIRQAVQNLKLAGKVVSKTNIFTEFRSLTGSTASISTFSYWVKALGWSFDRVNTAVLNTITGDQNDTPDTDEPTTKRVWRVTGVVKEPVPNWSPVTLLDESDLPGMPLSQNGNRASAMAGAAAAPAPSTAHARADDSEPRNSRDAQIATGLANGSLVARAPNDHALVAGYSGSKD